MLTQTEADALQEELNNLSDQQSRIALSHALDVRETMRSIAATSGAAMVGSMILLSIDIDKQPELIVAGIIFLGITSLLGFYHLLDTQSATSKFLHEQRMNLIVPRVNILTMYIDVKEGRMTSVEFDKKALDIAKKEREYRRNKQHENAKESIPKDIWTTVIAGSMGTGILFVLAGLIIPHLS